MEHLRSRQWPFGLQATELAAIAEAALVLGIKEFADIALDAAYNQLNGDAVGNLADRVASARRKARLRGGTFG